MDPDNERKTPEPRGSGGSAAEDAGTVAVDVGGRTVRSFDTGAVLRALIAKAKADREERKRKHPDPGAKDQPAAATEYVRAVDATYSSVTACLDDFPAGKEAEIERRRQKRAE